MNELSPRRVAWGLFLLRLMAGWVFLSEGIQKFLFPLLWLPADLRRSAFSLPEARTDFCIAPWLSSRDAVPAPSRRNK